MNYRFTHFLLSYEKKNHHSQAKTISKLTVHLQLLQNHFSGAKMLLSKWRSLSRVSEVRACYPINLINSIFFVRLPYLTLSTSSISAGLLALSLTNRFINKLDRKFFFSLPFLAYACLGPLPCFGLYSVGFDWSNVQ